MKYEVWYIPTPLGIKSFKWRPKLIDTFDKKEDADMCAYLKDADESAPDKHDYAVYWVIAVEGDILRMCEEEVFGALPEVTNVTNIHPPKLCEPIKSKQCVHLSTSIKCPNCGCGIHVEITKEDG